MNKQYWTIFYVPMPVEEEWTETEPAAFLEASLTLASCGYIDFRRIERTCYKDGKIIAEIFTPEQVREMGR